jgi:hypothetical protein
VNYTRRSLPVGKSIRTAVSLAEERSPESSVAKKGVSTVSMIRYAFVPALAPPSSQDAGQYCDARGDRPRALYDFV